MNVAFCTPGSTFSKEWVGAWTDLMFYCAQHRIGVIHMPAQFHNIHMVRDMCLGVNMGKKNQKPWNGEVDYDYIMWIDSDQVWTNQDFQKLLDADEDIVAGWYPVGGAMDRAVCAGWYSDEAIKDGRGMPVMTLNKFRKAYQNEKGLIDLAEEGAEWDWPWVGMGFMLVKKGVFENIPYPWFYDNNIMIGDTINNRGDDITFCQKAHEAGYKLYVHADVKVGHQKATIW